MALPRTLQQRITKLVDPPGKNRDVEEILLQVAQDPDCGAVVQQGSEQKHIEELCTINLHFRDPGVSDIVALLCFLTFQICNLVWKFLWPFRVTDSFLFFSE